MATTAPGSSTDNTASSRRQRVQAGIATIGSALQKINLPRLIMEMEKDQELADSLEVVNQEVAEERERQRIRQEALALCQAEIRSHLEDFLVRHPQASYDEWILDLHPENVSEGNFFSDMREVDLRFYVVDSDHRLMWNERVPDRHVPARTYKLAIGQEAPVDLLDDDFGATSTASVDQHQSSRNVHTESSSVSGQPPVASPTFAILPPSPVSAAPTAPASSIGSQPQSASTSNSSDSWNAPTFAVLPPPRSSFKSNSSNIGNPPHSNTSTNPPVADLLGGDW